MRQDMESKKEPKKKKAFGHILICDLVVAIISPANKNLIINTQSCVGHGFW